ncbi:Rieske (2Fe-2S) protein [Alicyclobacillus fodiniaquatilis]|uniref:Rieske (2Fe-2S) protein n=1 Tax=Alicyclobacillus fodiniaquatilis TaxID=1661150 RepID=A0ABW4JJM6_9BACL
MEQNISLVIAKSVIALIEAGVSEVEIAKVGVAFGTAERAAGWGPGLTILTAMVNVLPKLDAYGRILALSQGLAHVARDCAGQSTRHMLQSLPTTNFSLERLAAWYRECVEVRDTQGAERVLLTAIEKGADENQLADMMLVAATDHFYLNGGHTFDFHNKAFEMLEHVGEAQRKTTLTSLVPLLANPSRSEESQNWNAPVNLVKPLQEAFRELPEIVNDMQLVKAPELDEAQFVNQILSDDPLATVQVISQTLKRGVLPARVAQLVALAAAERITRFHIQNDFGDWIAVLHTFTHAHAVHERLLRGTDALAIRAIYYTAMRIYLDRFLNIPPARRPGTGKQAPQAYSTQPEELLELMDQRQQVSEAANWVANYLNNNGDVDALLNTLGHTLLREDAEFHSFQMYEAALNEYERWASVDSPMSECAKETMLFALTRYLAAHAPTARELPHVVRIAWRLQRGEKLFEEK